MGLRERGKGGIRCGERGKGGKGWPPYDVKINNDLPIQERKSLNVDGDGIRLGSTDWEQYNLEDSIKNEQNSWIKMKPVFDKNFFGPLNNNETLITIVSNAIIKYNIINNSWNDIFRFRDNSPLWLKNCDKRLNIIGFAIDKMNNTIFLCYATLNSELIEINNFV